MIVLEEHVEFRIFCTLTHSRTCQASLHINSHTFRQCAHTPTHIQATHEHTLIHRNMFSKPCFMMLRGQSRTSMHAGSYKHSIHQVPTHSKCSIMTHPCCRIQTMIHATLTKACHMTSNKIHVTSFDFSFCFQKNVFLLYISCFFFRNWDFCLIVFL